MYSTSCRFRSYTLISLRIETCFLTYKFSSSTQYLYLKKQNYFFLYYLVPSYSRINSNCAACGTYIVVIIIILVELSISSRYNYYFGSIINLWWSTITSKTFTVLPISSTRASSWSTFYFQSLYNSTIHDVTTNYLLSWWVVWRNSST